MVCLSFSVKEKNLVSVFFIHFCVRLYSCRAFQRGDYKNTLLYLHFNGKYRFMSTITSDRKNRPKELDPK